jgi:hypothetical protein
MSNLQNFPPTDRICENCNAPLKLIYDNYEHKCKFCGLVYDEDDDRYVYQNIYKRGELVSNNIPLNKNTQIGTESELYKSGNYAKYHKLQIVQNRQCIDEKNLQIIDFKRKFTTFNSKFGFEFDENILMTQARKLFEKTPAHSKFRNLEKISQFVYYNYAKEQGRFISILEIFPTKIDYFKIHLFFKNIESITPQFRPKSPRNMQYIKSLISGLCNEYRCDESVYTKAIQLAKKIDSKEQIAVCSSFLIAYSIIHPDRKKLSPHIISHKFNIAFSSIYKVVNTISVKMGYKNYAALTANYQKKEIKVPIRISFVPMVPKSDLSSSSAKNEVIGTQIFSIPASISINPILSILKAKSKAHRTIHSKCDHHIFNLTQSKKRLSNRYLTPIQDSNVLLKDLMFEPTANSDSDTWINNPGKRTYFGIGKSPPHTNISRNFLSSLIRHFSNFEFTPPSLLLSRYKRDRGPISSPIERSDHQYIDSG